MSPEDNESLLRSQWTTEHLGEYEGKWIAFKEGEIVASNASLQVLMEPFLPSMATTPNESGGPIFAFVTFHFRA